MADLATFTSPNLDVYFQSARAGIDGRLTQRLVEVIDATHSTLDVAIYDLRDATILEALARFAKVPGRQLRIAYDASGTQTTNSFVDPKPGTTADELAKHGLAAHATPVRLTGRHLMHDKFAISDARAVWTGSANFTHGGLALQDNQCLVLRSRAAAKSYQPVFDALITKPTVLAAPTPAKPMTISGAKVSLFYAPGAGEGIDQLCSRLIRGAKSVRLMAFVLTDPDILDALLDFKPARKDFQGIVDPAALSTLKKIKTLDPAVLWWTSDTRLRIARSRPFSDKRENDFQHNKVLIIDGHLVVCGSYNLSENAEANDENLLLIDSRPIAAAYNAYFDAVYATGRPPT